LRALDEGEPKRFDEVGRLSFCLIAGRKLPIGSSGLDEIEIHDCNASQMASFEGITPNSLSVLWHLRSQSAEVKPEDVVRLSPLADKHFNVLGRYRH
jgi:hypothetical protein